MTYEFGQRVKKGSLVDVEGQVWHVTRSSSAGVYGHVVDFCSESGCSAKSEFYLGHCEELVSNVIEEANHAES